MVLTYDTSYPILLVLLASVQDISAGVVLCLFGFCALFGHDCACDPMHLICTGGSTRLGLDIV